MIATLMPIIFSSAQQIQTLQGYIRVIGETLINVNNFKGNCQFNSDYTKLTEQQ